MSEPHTDTPPPPCEMPPDGEQKHKEKPKQPVFYPHGIAKSFSLQRRIIYLSNVGFHIYRNGYYCRDNDTDDLVEQAVADHLLNSGWTALIKQRREVITALSLREDILTPHGECNKNPNIIPLRNGNFNYVTGKLQPHTPNEIYTYQLHVAYDPAATCPFWEQYIIDKLPDATAHSVLQEWFGYCMTRLTFCEKAMVATGTGANGKSTMFYHTLQKMIGIENTSSQKIHTLSEPFHAIELRNKLINLCTELPSGDVTNTDQFQAIVSGEAITDAHKFRNAVTFEPFAKMIFLANELPKVVSDTDAYFRRLIMLRFPTSHAANPDDSYIERIQAELPGVFNWAMIGLRRLLEQRRFSTCETSATEIAAYRAACNPLHHFVTERLHFRDEAMSVKAEIYQLYKDFCTENNYRSLNNVNFWRKLRVLCPVGWEDTVAWIGCRSKRVVVGIEPVDPDAPPPGEQPPAPAEQQEINDWQE